tara:strand:- start:355 stop:822 length:468 start_codon:yes stop_codon:yes gene_type:complete
MKKLLVLLLLPLFSFGQIIVNQETIEVGKKLYRAADGSIRKQTKTITTKFDITEIKDEFINIYLGNRYHMLSTSKHKNVMISAHWRKRNWNVYDGDELIPMQDEVDVLNFFSKYGFEFFKQNTKPTSAWTTSFFSNSAVTTISAKSSITLRNNNN